MFSNGHSFSVGDDGKFCFPFLFVCVPSRGSRICDGQKKKDVNVPPRHHVMTNSDLFFCSFPVSADFFFFSSRCFHSNSLFM